MPPKLPTPGFVIKRPSPGLVYRYIRKPDHPLAQKDGYVAEHRMVAWDAGLFDDPSLDVHHKNEDTLDNHVENLEPVTSGQHRREHARGGTRNQHGLWPAVEGPCSIDGCDLPADSRGWCSAHLTRFIRYGDPLLVRRVNVKTVRPYVLVPT